MFTRSLMYCGERSFTIFVYFTCHKFEFSNMHGLSICKLSNSLREDVKSLLMNLNALS